ncbi:MAG: hypothetical protein ACXAC7_22805 [Candidatus Hodarchaeales archaeon]|jgi:hypothetical protein
MSDEDILRPPQNKINPENTPYPAKFIEVKGKKLVIRQVSREEIPTLLKVVYQTITIDKDFYDLVGVRLYGELLSYYKYRVHDEYCLVVQLEGGEVVGIVNGRLKTEPKVETGVSYHTMALKRGLRVGLHAFVAKMEYHMEYLKNTEVIVVAESPIGFRRWMGELKIEPKPAGYEHELGGVPSFVLTKENWENHVKPNKCEGIRPVPDDLLASVKEIKLPEDVYFQITGEKR